MVLIEICWERYSCRVWRFDTLLRRALKRDLRQLSGGYLVVVEEIFWAYSDEQQNEFDQRVATRISQLQGSEPEASMMVITDYARTSMQTPADFVRVQKPIFGNWTQLIREASVKSNDRPSAVWMPESGEADIGSLNSLLSPDGNWRPIPFFAEGSPSFRLIETYPAPPGVSISSDDRPPWNPPRPLKPAPDFLTLSQAPRTLSARGQIKRLESLHVGFLQVPTGQLIACDPDDYFLEERLPYTASIPPGTYRFFVNVSSSPDGTAARIAAAGILVRDDDVTCWELAVLPGEDIRLLPDGTAYGFGVDSGMACIFDASFLPTVAATFADADRTLSDSGVPGVRILKSDDSIDGAALIVFDSGWGDGRYPVWIGKMANGKVACVVADMQLDAAQ
ncbi:DUF4241 domain-containing protein [Streptomyces sp. NPDC006976]|uniref:DUF4241 domain-containing protein n=1 Tax=Streptomyces sp. NPDC006976 TaxID=3154311 RepID=UPI003407069F